MKKSSLFSVSLPNMLHFKLFQSVYNIQRIVYLIIFLLLLFGNKNYASVGEGISPPGKLTSIPTARLSYLTYGPKSDSIEVPTNGKGYAYFKFKPDQIVNLTLEEPFDVELEKPNTEMYLSKGMFLADTLLRITVDKNVFVSIQNTDLYTTNVLNTVNGKFCISEDSLSISVKKKKAVYSRTWDIFAGKSAGVSGTIGSVGIGASASAAKLSVKGMSGVGFQIQKDEKNYLYLDRRMEKGVSVSFEVPSVNAVVDEVKFDLGGRSEIIAKTLVGQRFCFSDLNISEDKKRMAQSGFMLETLSMGGGELSPIVGIYIKAIVLTLNAISGVDNTFENALLTNYGAIGIEGSLGIGFKSELGPYKIKALDKTEGFALSLKMSSHQRKLSKVYSNPFNINSSVGTNINLTLAMKYQFSTFSLGFGFNDKVELASSQYALFDTGFGGEASLSADLDEANNMSLLSVNLKGGYDVVLLGRSRKDYYDAKIEFPKEYFSLLESSGLSLAGFFASTMSMPIGNSLIEDAVNSMDYAINKFIRNKPIKITTNETKGKGSEMSLGISLDAALGVGAGLSLGVFVKYFDEIQYPKKYSEIYKLRKNYLLYSSEYQEEMGSDKLRDILKELFSGTTELIVDAFKTLRRMITRITQAGERFVIEIRSLNETLIGEIEGRLNAGGTWFMSIFSSDSPRMWAKAFAEPKYRKMYYSTRVKHKKVVESGIVMEDIMTTLVIVSESMNLSFTPNGSNTPIDSLDSPISVKMLIDEQKLTSNGFSLDDKDRIKIYRYDIDSLSWILEGGIINQDTISVDITKLGTLALGIELFDNDDNEAPEIWEWGPSDGSIHNEYPELYGKLKDNKYGRGICLLNSHIILDGDTLNISYEPVEQRIYYSLSEDDSLEDGTHYVRIIATDLNKNSTELSFSFDFIKVSVKEENIPHKYSLYQNYPNPFNPYTTISFEIPEVTAVAINIYDVQGRYLRSLIKGKMNTGKHHVVWDGKNNFDDRVSSGIYFYQLKTESVNIVKKMQLLK